MRKLLLRILLFVVIASFAAALYSCGNDDNSAPAGMVTASDEKADFYLYVPDDWTVDMTTRAAGAYFSESDPSSVSVMAWELEHTDTTVEEWWDINLEEVKLVFSNVEIVAEENTTVDDLYAKKYEYTASLGEFNYKIMQVALVKNAEVYVFTYTSIADNYDTHLDDVNQMLEYLTIK